ncbi:MAG: four helix bundle protein [Nitrospirales bacterium]|nr:four helix bundle protein [Nitrospirales bacterium]
MKQHNFRNLKIYQRATDFTVEIYKTSKSFPQDELFGLTSQIRRAALSISLNIAEGSGNKSEKEFQRFLQMALRSVYEVMTALEIAYRLNYSTKEEFDRLSAEADEIAAMVVGLSKSLTSDL